MKKLLPLLLAIYSLAANGQSDKEMKAINDMVAWLESPMELNKPPETISIRDSTKLFWPSEEIVEAYLVDFTDEEGNKHVGFAGPITWTFFNIDFNKLSNEELYKLYTGWFICFYSYHQQDKNDPIVEQDRKLMIKKIEEMGYVDFNIKPGIQMAGQTFFEISATKNGLTKIVVGTFNEIVEYDADEILPLYKLIGELWDPLNKDSH